ncbi:MAG: hypothetical protein ACOH12_08405 [Parvibaculaceae bacterium]
MSKTHTLVLVNHPWGQERRDLEEIAAKVEALAPEISTHIVPHDMKADECDLPADVWSRPTLNVAFQWPQKFRPARGLTYTGRPINKSVQTRKYDTAGVAVPPTVTYQFGRALNRNFWGDFVIMKPTRLDMMSHGNNIFLMRTERVAALAPRIYPPQHPARTAPVLIQKFINTGGASESYRVLTLFGEPIHSMLFRQPENRAPLYAPDEVLLKTSVASNAGDAYVHQLINDPEIMAFARRAAAAMPFIPLQGIDVIREMGTGKLYVLESNPGGNTWHFSSRMSVETRKIVTREQRIEQFGAWDIAAKVLAERTLKEAR